MPVKIVEVVYLFSMEGFDETVEPFNHEAWLAVRVESKKDYGN